MLTVAMDVLFFISVACFFALFVAALAIARHVRIERVHRRPDYDEIRSTGSGTSERQSPFDRGRVQTVQNFSREKEPDWRFLISDGRAASDQIIETTLRKPVASTYSDGLQRLNLRQFNNDPGDLSDPYQPPLTRAVRAGGRRGLLMLPRKEAS